MRDTELLNIGAFSVLTGLSIVALRHYDEVALLQPAVIDPVTGYRRYRPDQVPAGRLIHTLRAVDMPIDRIREVLARDETATRAALVAHREQIDARHRALARTLELLDDYIENGVRMTQPTGSRIAEINLGVDDVDACRTFYEAVFELEFTEERHGDGPVHWFAAFGSWPSDEFFLLNLSAADRDPYRAGRADFGFLVGDLEAAHQRALTAGGTEITAPCEVDGMPRTSTVVDPSGNLINLYQNV